MATKTLPPLISTLLALLALLTIIKAEACVAGGPASLVTAAEACCSSVSGTRYQFYAVQAICVFDENQLDTYDDCVVVVAGKGRLDTRCISGTGGLGGDS